jgi:endonuclease/exonuclease/phosphatase family metal-dependent hydrolase
MPALKVMTWNVENLFRPPADPGPADAPVYRRKLQLLAETLGRIGPDVIALQELGGADALDDLREQTGGAYPHAAVSAFPDRRGIRVGFLSRFPVEDAEDVVDFPALPGLRIDDLGPDGGAVSTTRMGRGSLRVRIRPDGAALDLVTAHLKSKLLSFPAAGGGTRFEPRDEAERAQAAVAALARRAAEAATLRVFANGLLVGNRARLLIMLGDMNDVPEAATTQILHGPPGSELGTSGFDRPDRGDDARLFNLAPRIAEERRFSRVFRGRGELLDRVLVSAELLPVQPDGRRRLPVAVESHIDFAEGLPSINENPRERAAAVAPDHAPVTATFEL